MNTKDLNELKEMTGLVSEAELNNNNNAVAVGAADEMLPDDALLDYVGKPVAVGKTCGIIDGVYGKRLGYVCSSGDCWESSLVWPQDVVCVKDEASEEKARTSARVYFEREISSLMHRAKLRLACDNHASIMEQLANARLWASKI